MAKPRILIVEDEEVVALAIRTFLERVGYEVPLITPRGEEALSRLQEISPDLVLMDIKLGGELSGIQTAAAIKEASSIPVIYLTAYSDAETLELAKLTEPGGYVLKPFDERGLEAAIKMAIYKASTQRELRRARDKMSSILESIGDGIIVASPEGVVEYANATAVSCLSLPAELPSLKDLTLIDRATRARVSLAELCTGGAGRELRDSTLAFGDRARVVADVRLEPLKEANGKVKGTVITLRESARRGRIQELIQRELESAADFHKNLLPHETVDLPGLRMSGFLLAAAYGAGDIYNFFSIDERYVGAYVADILGHGVAAASAALLVSRLLSPDETHKSRLPILDVDPRAPSRVVSRLNDMFYGSADQLFFTICYLVIDRENRKARLVRAGHPYPLMQRTNGAVQEIRSGGYAVGLARRIDAPEIDVELSPGDRLYFYSDGLTECADQSLVRYSREKLMSLIEASATDGVAATVSRIKDSVISWRGAESFDDDVSLMGVEVTSS